MMKDQKNLGKRPLFRPSSKDLPASGTIRLSQVKTEFDKGNNLLDYLGEGGVTSSAPLKLTDFYGTVASDAVVTENFGDGYNIGLHGYTGQGSSGTLESTLSSDGREGNNFSKVDLLTWPHKWPVSLDGQPHAFIADYPSAVQNREYGKEIPKFNEFTGNNTFKWFRYSSSSVCRIKVQPYNRYQGAHATALQRVKPGARTFNGYAQMYKPLGSNTPDPGAGTVTVNLLEFETMTPSGNSLASAGGRSRRTRLGRSTNESKQTFSTLVNTKYEWLFLEVVMDQTANADTDLIGHIDSIT
jgi:hypothetical protein